MKSSDATSVSNTENSNLHFLLKVIFTNLFFEKKVRISVLRYACLVSGTLSVGCMNLNENAMDLSTPSGALVSLYVSPPVFVAGGSNCSIWISRDAGDWSFIPNALPGCFGSGTVNEIAYGNGMFVAVGSTASATNGCGIWTSFNGRNWTQKFCGGTTANTLPLNSVIFSKSRSTFIAGGSIDGSGNCSIQSGSIADLTWSESLYNCSGNLNVTSLTEIGSTILASVVGPVPVVLQIPNATSSNAPANFWFNDPYSYKLTQIGNGRLLIYGRNISTTLASLNYSDNLGAGWGPSSTDLSGGPTYFNRAVTVPSESKFVGIGDNACSIGVYFSGASIFNGSSLISNCSGVLLSAISYSPNEARYLAGGTLGGQTIFASSPDGLQSSWTFQQPLSTTDSVRSIAASL